MIVQSAPPGEARFIILQTEHARACGSLVRQFGNATFDPIGRERPGLLDLFEFVVAHHDEGWAAVDASPTLDPNTHFPHHLTQTPFDRLLVTNAASPDFNEGHHPLCGVISSMHTYGLYHGRYGLSDKVFIDTVPSEGRPRVEAMLAAEVDRQLRLRLQLSAHPDSAAWAATDFLFYLYKLLQFFDTLALYVQTQHPAARTETRLYNVPRTPTEDVTIQVQPVSDTQIALTPFPFAGSRVVMVTPGRLMPPLLGLPGLPGAGVNLAEALAAAPYLRQEIEFVAGGSL